MPKSKIKLDSVLTGYSVEDLVRSFFTVNMWLPNVGSPIRLEYLYCALECLGPKLPKTNRINSYGDFDKLCAAVFEELPTFSMLEDYLPESDWGDVKHFFNNKSYKIFYGASLSNPVDFYSAFEVIHAGFDSDYKSLLGRSPLTELEFCLAVQDVIIEGFDMVGVPRDKAEPGYLEIPPEGFWDDCRPFLDEFSSGNSFSTQIADQYSFVPAMSHAQALPNLSTFSDRAMEGKNCFYFFIRFGDRYFPAIPRKHLSVLYDTWGDLLEKNLVAIEKTNKHVNGIMDIELFNYANARIKDSDIFGLVTALEPGDKPQDMTFACALHADDRLYLIHIVPIVEYLKDLDGYLKGLTQQLSAVSNRLTNAPTRLGVWSEQKIVEFRPKNGTRALKPVYIVTTPYLKTELKGIVLPEELPATLIPMDQLLGLFDEVEDAEELGRFLDYREKLLSEYRVLPITSFLDLYGSFKDSHSVLIGGAVNPTMLFLDPNWGTNYRYQSLSSFWSKFPDVSFIGHPRGWVFPKEGPEFAIKSKRFKAYAYFETVGGTVCFINCPVVQMEFEEGKLADLVMQAIRDALGLYKKQISSLAFTAQVGKLQIFCSPTSAVQRSEQLKHLRALIPQGELWKLGTMVKRPGEVGISVVLNNDALTQALLKATDRSIEIDLLIAILDQLNALWPDDNLPEVKKSLRAERAKKVRFRLYMQEKEVSFPEYVPVILPEPSDFKLADKVIAELANSLKIIPGEYEQEKAKEILNSLIGSLVAIINKKVGDYDLERSIPILLNGIEALVHNHETTGVQVRESLAQEVEYEREDRLSTDKGLFLHDHQTYRYLIEKFVQLAPDGPKVLSNEDMRALLAHVERLLNMYSASDHLHYGIFPANLIIDNDFIARVSYAEDIEKREKEFGIEKAKLELGSIGNCDDIPEIKEPIESHLKALDQAFESDFRFSMRDIVGILKLLSLWASNSEVEENTFYSATCDDIAKHCAVHFPSLDKSTLERVLDLATLTQSEIIQLAGNSLSEPDIPVWEYTKRQARYTIKPLIQIHDKYYWGPYSANKAGQLWMNTPFRHKLPLPLRAPNTLAFLGKSHDDYTRLLQTKIADVVRRYTSDVLESVYPHKYDSSSVDIGDIDVMAYSESQGLLLNIESKIIDHAYCLKDARRVAWKLFGRTRENGSHEEGYLHKVETRHRYLQSKAVELIGKVGWTQPKKPLVIESVFVTQSSFWWTRFPPVETDVKFVECRLLDDFVQTCLGESTKPG
jgi:hypothetical protein